MVHLTTAETVAIIAVPHVMFVFIWFFPKRFQRLCKPFDAVNVFAALASILKVVQLLALYAWYTQSGPPHWAALTPAQLAVGGVLVAIGQTLNAGIYKAIGKNGVYYGFKLGKKVPWVNGFPFNVRHPQYVGAVMSVWGGLLLLHDGRHPEMLQLGLGWTACYVVSAIQEDFF